MRDEGARAYEMRRVRVHAKDGTRVQEKEQLCKNKTEVYRIGSWPCIQEI
jgi:hypothetical protein